MTQSMTGFAKSETVQEGFAITVELKSVNNRFKEIRFRIPHQFSLLEMKLRDVLGQTFRRGSFDVSINIKKSNVMDGELLFDSQKVEKYLAQIKKVSEKLSMNLTLSTGDFLRTEFLVQDGPEDNEALNGAISKVFELALIELKKSRESEGSKLISAILLILNNYEDAFKKVKSFAGDYKKNIESKLNNKLAEYKDKIQIDQNRLLQELIFYLEKLDVEEEFTRVESHLSKMREIILQSSEKGRQLDFLLQELGRETNTIGSKSADSRISQQVVEMKTFLEKIREQALNLE
jgi:uncharacterized protein (TIGR00255 family)